MVGSSQSRCQTVFQKEAVTAYIIPVHEATISPFRKGDEKIEDCLTRWFTQRMIGEPMLVVNSQTDEFLGLVAEGTKGPYIHIAMLPRTFSEIHAENKSRRRSIFQSLTRHTST